MKYLYLFLFVFFLYACSSTQKVSCSGESCKMSKELFQFLSKFENATGNHNKEQLVSILDKIYKQKNYEGLTGHDELHFFRVFYCGRDVKTKDAVCPAFREVISIEFKDIKQSTDGTFVAYYIVHTIYEDLDAKWKITVSKVNEKIVFGLLTDFG